MDDSGTSSIANEIKDIVYANQPKLLMDEIEALHKIGIHATPRFMEISYFSDTSRVSTAWSGRIHRKTDVMKTSLLMLPDDIRKSARVKEWMGLNPELTRQTKTQLDKNRNGSCMHK